MNKKISTLILVMWGGITSTYAQFNTVMPKSTIDTVKKSKENLLLKDSSKEVRKVSFIPLKKEKVDLKYFNIPINTDTLIITSKFGYRKHPITGKNKFHKGVDLRAKNQYVYSILPGKIIKTGQTKKLGKYIEIQHGNFKSIYGHLSSILVNKQQYVNVSQPIGISGSTGQVTAAHLHLGVKYMNKHINPEPILRYMERVKKGLETNNPNPITP